MNYAIYQSNDNADARIMYRFTQETCNHRAKAAAREKLQQLWCQALYRESLCLIKDAKGSQDEISYDKQTSVNTYMRVRFFIAPLKASASL